MSEDWEALYERMSELRKKIDTIDNEILLCIAFFSQKTNCIVEKTDEEDIFKFTFKNDQIEEKLIENWVKDFSIERQINFSNRDEDASYFAEESISQILQDFGKNLHSISDENLKNLLLYLLYERFCCSLEVARIKKHYKKSIEDKKRKDDMIENKKKIWTKLWLDDNKVWFAYEYIHDESCKLQKIENSTLRKMIFWLWKKFGKRYTKLRVKDIDCMKELNE